MTHYISSKGDGFRINNFAFKDLFDLAIEIGDRIVTPNEEPFLILMKQRQMQGYFWPGRDLDIAEDFPSIPEQKFWCRVFLETARAIFDRTIGNQDQNSWQVPMIYSAFSMGKLLQNSVQQTERNWKPNTKDKPNSMNS